MKLIKTKLERKVWNKITEAQAAGSTLPKLTSQEAAAMRRLMSRYPQWDAERLQEREKAWICRKLAWARCWAYSNLPGFRRHEGVYHPDLREWARKNGQEASQAAWITAARIAHRKHPICLDGYCDTEPVAEANLGSVKRIPARINSGHLTST